MRRSPATLPAHRLRARRDFERLRATGRTWGHRLMALDALEHRAGATRCGFVVSKRVGSAVTRNRVKRRLREAARAMLPRLRPGWDLAFRVRPAAAAAPLRELRAAMEELTLRAGALGVAGSEGEASRVQ